MRNRLKRRTLSKLARRAVLGLALWNGAVPTYALAPPQSSSTLLKPNFRPPQLSRIGGAEVSVLALPTAVSQVADQDDNPATELLDSFLMDRWAPRGPMASKGTEPKTTKPTPSQQQKRGDEIPRIAEKPPALLQIEDSIKITPPVTNHDATKPKLAPRRLGELQWQSPDFSQSGKSATSSKQIAPASPSTKPASPSTKPASPSTKPASPSTKQIVPRQAGDDPSLEVTRIPADSKSVESRAIEPSPSDSASATKAVTRNPNSSRRAASTPDSTAELRKQESEFVETLPSITSRTYQTPQNRRRRDGDPADDVRNSERSEPAEIASDEPLHEVEIPIESFGNSALKQLPQLSKPSQRSRAQDSNRDEAIVVRASVQRLKQPIADCLRYYYQRPEEMAKRSPWGTFHSLLPFGVDGKVVAGKRSYNGIAWLCGNNSCRGQKLLSIDARGNIKANEGIGLQGHQAQFLAILGQLGVPSDYPLYVNNKRFTVADLIKSEQQACKDGSELTFTLIGLSSFLPTDATWRSADGQVWDFERLIREEMKQPIVGAACGGTHRLMGFSYSLRQRSMEGQPIQGQWVRGEQYVEDFLEYGWSLQNPDGSFSSDWLEGRADNGNLDRKLQTSGHIAEWLIFSSPKASLQEERVVRAVSFLMNTLTQDPSRSFEVGPKGHALRALALYHSRVFEERQPWLSKGEPQQALRPSRLR